MTDDRPDVRIVGPEKQVLHVERTLGNSLIAELAHAARAHDVMISLTVTPYDDDDDNDDQEDAGRDPNDR